MSLEYNKIYIHILTNRVNKNIILPTCYYIYDFYWIFVIKYTQEVRLNDYLMCSIKDFCFKI